jgi:hypothetical protein
MSKPDPTRQFADLLKEATSAPVTDEDDLVWEPGSNPPTEQERQDMSKAGETAVRSHAFAEFLKAEGYVPTVDTDGDILFKFEGRTYVLLLDDEDTEFFRIVFPNFWEIESDDERRKIEKAALVATSDTKAAKVYPVRDDTWASIEIFAATDEAFQRVFSRSMSALQSVIRNFSEEMKRQSD